MPRRRHRCRDWWSEVAIYVPSAFAVDSAPALALIRSYPFATLLSVSAANTQHVTHLPLLWCDNGTALGALEGHLARANPHAAEILAGTASLAIFNGPHAYVSPTWYGNPQAMVPTWNYAVVHVQGDPVALTDASEALAVLETAIQHFESGIGSTWRRQRDDSYLRLVDSILAFRIPIRQLQPKFKLSQNRSADDRARVTARLAAVPETQSHETARWMQNDECH